MPPPRTDRALRAHSRFGRRALLLLVLPCLSSTAHASIFQGETLDKVANIMSWVVLAVVPIVCISVFWLVHVLPEKIAEKRHHPQAKAIHVLCLLSLFFGGLLWPLAWLWAYSKPVMYKLAYGTDVDMSHAKKPSASAREDELKQLRQRIIELERADRDQDRS